jgi:galactonate dehydratase
MRDWVGQDCELAFDFHGKLTPALAVDVCRAIADVRPLFVEEPIPQENVPALREVALKAPMPIATGERLLSRWEFRQVFELQAAAYIQPDVSHAGGISELRRIAAMAETYYVHIAPHCAIGPVALAACLQVDAAVPNFLIQEQVDRALGEGFLLEPLEVKDGAIELPTAPGLGIQIDPKVLEETVTEPEEELGGEFRHPDDGSIADW